MELRHGERSSTGYTEVSTSDPHESYLLTTHYPTVLSPRSLYMRFLSFRLQRDAAESIGVFVPNATLAKIGKSLSAVTIDTAPTVPTHEPHEHIDDAKAGGFALAHDLATQIETHLASTASK